VSLILLQVQTKKEIKSKTEARRQ